MFGDGDVDDEKVIKHCPLETCSNMKMLGPDTNETN